MRLFARTSIVVVIGLSMTSCAFPNKRFTPPTQAASAPVERTFNELDARINDGEAAGVCALYFWPSNQCHSIWRARLANMRRPVRLSVLKMTLGCGGDARVTYIERSPAGRRLRTLSVSNYQSARYATILDVPIGNRLASLQIPRYGSCADAHGEGEHTALLDPAAQGSTVQCEMMRARKEKCTKDRVSAPPICAFPHLRAVIGPTVGEATEQRTLVIRLANGEHHACRLHGFPRVILADARGVIPFSIKDGGDQMIPARRPRRVVVRPGGSAFVVLNKNECDGVTRQTRLTREIRIGIHGRPATDFASVVFRHPASVPSPWRIPAYCGRSDLRSRLTVSPFVSTIRAALIP